MPGRYWHRVTLSTRRATRPGRRAIIPPWNRTGWSPPWNGSRSWCGPSWVQRRLAVVRRARLRGDDRRPDRGRRRRVAPDVLPLLRVEGSTCSRRDERRSSPRRCSRRWRHRPPDEPPLVAIERALVPVLESRIARTDRLRTIIRLLRESRTLRRAMLGAPCAGWKSGSRCRYRGAAGHGRRQATARRRFAFVSRRDDGRPPSTSPTTTGAAMSPRSSPSRSRSWASTPALRAGSVG